MCTGSRPPEPRLGRGGERQRERERNKVREKGRGEKVYVGIHLRAVTKQLSTYLRTLAPNEMRVLTTEAWP